MRQKNKRSKCEGTICRSRANAPNAAAASRTPSQRPADARWTASRWRYTRRRFHDSCPPSRVPITPAETR
eukprot:482422-Alexandrium_andersonii.AAC.1